MSKIASACGRCSHKPPTYLPKNAPPSLTPRVAVNASSAPKSRPCWLTTRAPKPGMTMTAFSKARSSARPRKRWPKIRHAPATRERGQPTYVGRYRILRRHGEGGMGTVFEAEQHNPRRTVALKVIRSDFVSPELVGRFKNEAQILARLQHTGIAQVYEAGMCEDGRPFFAMEYIRGMPLDEYARGRGLDPRACLELVAKVCDAVQHAHDKGVVHRDLKPGNILVEESGQPKVLDFGVAHVTAADLLTTSSQTRTGQLLGTLSYMSPEQLGARPTGLDGRSDVYTLGVILFELLAHRLPYHLDQLPVHEVARVIDQQEPSRLSSIDKRYRGDVETIVGKALEKDKARRYARAADLASDIRRDLRGEPIRARKVGTAERSWRWARRNPTVAGLGAALERRARAHDNHLAVRRGPHGPPGPEGAESGACRTRGAGRIPIVPAARPRRRERQPRPRPTAPCSARSEPCGPGISPAGVRWPWVISPGSPSCPRPAATWPSCAPRPRPPSRRPTSTLWRRSSCLPTISLRSLSAPTGGPSSPRAAGRASTSGTCRETARVLGAGLGDQ